MTTAVRSEAAEAPGEFTAASDSGRPLRLCFVSADYPTSESERQGIGGIGAHTSNLAHGVAALGHDVLVLSETEGAPLRYSDGAVRVHALSRGSMRLWKLGRLVPVPWLRRTLAVWRALGQLHREMPFDFVRFPDGYGEGFRYSLTPFVPYSVHLHGPASLLQRWDGRHVPPVRARVETALERPPVEKASMLVTATQRFAAQIADEWKLDVERIRIIRNPLNVEFFRSAPMQSERVVLFAGHIQWLKGMATLVQAIPIVLARHADARFVLIGNDTRSAPDGGSMRRYMENELAQRGVLDRVTFREPLAQRELIEQYQACTAFVLPSYQEVYGNVVLEAMACERPCIVTSAVGSAELIRSGETGYIVPPQDPVLLAGAIGDALALPAHERSAMGARARQTVVRTCAVESIADQTVSAIRSVLEGAGHPLAPTESLR